MILLSGYGYAQEFKADTLIKDLDADKYADSIFFDKTSSRIICKLSSQGFEEIKSKELENIDFVMAGIRTLNHGFEFFNNWMRAGYSCFFSYDKARKKIRLTAINRYEFGNAVNDGSGNSSINLITHQYLGNWNYFDEEKEKLVKMPAIKKNLVLPYTDLQNFSEQQVEAYIFKCSDLYETLKTKMRNSGKRGILTP